MVMRKGKTDLERFRTIDPDNTTPETPPEAATKPTVPEKRISKNTRMLERHSEMLSDQAFYRGKQEGRRVTEAELLEEALEEWRLKRNLPM